MQVLQNGKDVVLDVSDFVLFFMLNYFQMFVMFIQVIISGKKWFIINYCFG